MSSPTPDRGDFVYINFDPQAGHEQAGARPALVLSPRAFNESTGFAFVAPITSKQKGYPFEVPIPVGQRWFGVILVDQVRSLDWKARKLTVEGRADEQVMDEVLARLAPIFGF